MTYHNIHSAGTTYYPQVQLEWAPGTQPTAGTQSYIDITTRLREWAWQFGRNDELGDFDPGAGYVLLDNLDRAFDPDYTAGTWYGNVKPRKAFRMTWKIDTTVGTVFVAYARGFPQTWPAAGHDAVVRVDLVDYMAILGTFQLPVGFTRDVELSGARVAAVLDAIGFPSGGSYRALYPGTVWMDAIEVETVGTYGLSHIRECAAAEFGQFFMRNGVAVFHDRTVRLGLAQTFFPLYEFADDPSAQDARYDTQFTLNYDDTYLVNNVIVNAADPELDEPGVAVGTTSQADYWEITKPIQSQLAYEPDRTALAEYHVLRYQQPEYRTPALSFQLGGQVSSLHRKNVLQATISDPITVVQFGGGTAEIALSQVVEGVSHVCRPGGPWELTLQTSPADTRTYWTLEDGVYGAIDDPDILIAP
jgi:hypothetical protein